MSATPSSSEFSGSSESTGKREFPSDEDKSSFLSREDGSTSDQSNSRKRKFSGQYEKSIGKRQLSFPYYSRYNALYNATVDEVGSTVDADDLNQWRPGRIGLSYWSSKEKEAFFAALDRKGRDDIKGISSLVGSKSESEVRIFILGLQKGVVENARDDCSLRIPAAFEISERCEKELESAALGLAQRQLAVEEEAEQRRHGYWWLLDDEAAIKLENLSSEETHPSMQQDLEITIRLFNITKMVELSSKIYMNSKNMDDNWTTLLGEKSSPGIYGTALVDFYSLVVEIIKRVVASAMFLAQSRNGLRKRNHSRSTQQSIGYRDMKSACQLLGLDHDRKAYWIGLARRCNLSVYDQRYKSSRKKPLSLDEAERSLSLNQQPGQEEFRGAASNKDTSIYPMTEHTASTSHDNDLVEDTEEEEMERSDIVASRQEEMRLRRAIGKGESTPGVAKDEDPTSISDGRAYHIETAKDWRQDFDYRPPWQSATGLPSETLFTSSVGMRYSNESSTAEALPADD